MSKKRTFLAEIFKVERLNNSVNGNPAYRVTFDLGNQELETYRTQSDSSISYSIQNQEYRDVMVEVYLTRANRIYHIAPTNIRPS